MQVLPQSEVSRAASFAEVQLRQKTDALAHRAHDALVAGTEFNPPSLIDGFVDFLAVFSKTTKSEYKWVIKLLVLGGWSFVAYNIYYAIANDEMSVDNEVEYKEELSILPVAFFCHMRSTYSLSVEACRAYEFADEADMFKECSKVESGYCHDLVFEHKIINETRIKVRLGRSETGKGRGGGRRRRRIPAGAVATLLPHATHHSLFLVASLVVE